MNYDKTVLKIYLLFILTDNFQKDLFTTSTGMQITTISGRMSFSNEKIIKEFNSTYRTNFTVEEIEKLILLK